MLSTLVSTVSNSQVFLLKNVSSFCKCKSYSHFFSKNISLYALFNDQCFNDMLSNNIVSFSLYALLMINVLTICYLTTSLVLVYMPY